MNDKQDRPFVCSAQGCSQRFQTEEHLILHRRKHEMTLKFSCIKTDTAFTDQTPTPTRFLQNCEEVGLFKEIEEEFLQAQEEEKSKQNLSHNEPSCMNHLKAQLQHPHPQPQLHHPTHPLQHPPPHGIMVGPSCSLAAQQVLSSSHCGSVSTQTTSTLTHSGPVPGPLSSLLHMRNRHRHPLPASLPGPLPDPAMQGASAQHMPIEKQMSCIMGLPGPVHNPSCSSPQRSKQTQPHPFQQHHPGLVALGNPVTSMGHMMEMMPRHHQTHPLQHDHPPPPPSHHHHHHHQSQLSAPSLTYQPRCHAPPSQHLSGAHSHQLHQSASVPHAQAHPSPPPHLHQGSPPAPPLSAPAQLSPDAQQMQSSQPAHSQHAGLAGGSCSAGGVGGGGGGGGGSRRRRTAEHDPDERRQKFLERNRAAATRCRQKRKLWVSSLEKKAEELTHTNLQLQNEVTSLRSEVGQLKQILLTHKDCPVTARQREAQGYPTAGVSPGGSPTPVGRGSRPQAIQHNSISTSSTAGGEKGRDPQPAR